MRSIDVVLHSDSSGAFDRRQWLLVVGPDAVTHLLWRRQRVKFEPFYYRLLLRGQWIRRQLDLLVFHCNVNWLKLLRINYITYILSMFNNNIHF